MSIMSSIVWRTGTTKQKMSYPKLNCFDPASRITNTYKCWWYIQICLQNTQ